MNKLAKRSLSFVTAMFLSIMSMVTGISESLAANPVSNVSGTKKTDDVTLLVGENGMKGSTIAETIKNYEKTYALGIASQFCVFLEGNFEPEDADAEGRIAVGGNVAPPISVYEIGKGDFQKKVSLELLLNDDGFAHVITHGSAKSLIPTAWDKDYTLPDGSKGNTAKKFWVTDKENIQFQEDFLNFASSDLWSKDPDDYIYEGAENFDIKAQVATLKEISNKFSKKSSGQEVGIDSNNGHFRLEYKGSQADTVYFNLTEEQWKEYQSTPYVDFVNIPKLKTPRPVVNNDGTKGSWEYAYIVINVEGSGEIHLANPDVGYGQRITNISGTTDIADGICISRTSPEDDDKNKNNHPGVTSLLYNFPDATGIVIGSNFQGTILAPNADVTDEAKLGKGEVGHLSGALIAKSFKGKTEFGYRPFTGPISMLGTVAGYALAVSKVDGNGNNLAGATLGLVLSDDKTGEVVSEIETVGSKYNFITVPTDVELTGDEKFDSENYLHEKLIH